MLEIVKENTTEPHSYKIESDKEDAMYALLHHFVNNIVPFKQELHAWINTASSGSPASQNQETKYILHIRGVSIEELKDVTKDHQLPNGIKVKGLND